jgi:hypothetical protein
MKNKMKTEKYGKCKTENKNDNMQDNNKTKIKCFANLKGQDNTHVGATSPSLGVCTSW